MISHFFHKLLALMTVAILIQGCKQGSPIAVTNTIESTPSITNIPTEIASLVATRTSTRTITPEPLPCLEQPEVPTVEFTSVHGLIITEVNRITFSRSYRISGSDLLEKVAQNTGKQFTPGEVSPDHLHIILGTMASYGENSETKVTDANGHVIWSATKKGGINYIGWYDDNRLLHMSFVDDIYQLNLINLLTRNSQKLKLDFPDVGDPGFFWGIPQFKYNSDLSKVLYPGASYSLGGGLPSIFPIIYYDVRKDQEIARIPTYSRKGPIWLPDWSKYVFVGDFKPDETSHMEIYSMDLDGNLQQLTHLNDTYPGVNISSNLSFSSESRYTAFWFSYETSSSTTSESRFAVMDMETDKMDIYCIQGANERDHHSADEFGSPIWSPDNKLIAVPIYDPNNPIEKGIGIIDVSQKKVSIIRGMGNVQPSGWLDLP